MSKDQTTKADGLRAMREETRGHLQATADKPKPLVPYAGKERHQGAVPFSKKPRPPNDKPPRNRRKYKRNIA